MKTPLSKVPVIQHTDEDTPRGSIWGRILEPWASVANRDSEEVLELKSRGSSNQRYHGSQFKSAIARKKNATTRDGSRASQNPPNEKPPRSERRSACAAWSLSKRNARVGCFALLLAAAWGATASTECQCHACRWALVTVTPWTYTVLLVLRLSARTVFALLEVGFAVRFCRVPCLLHGLLFYLRFDCTVALQRLSSAHSQKWLDSMGILKLKWLFPLERKIVGWLVSLDWVTGGCLITEW